jgi:uracil-DNA glycosylase family 4
MSKGPRTSCDELARLAQQVSRCRRCPRLVNWCRDVAQQKRAAYADETYWGKPVPGVGDCDAGLVVVGLAPGAHGANRTGRMFTGDRSGDWLYGALYRAGFANQPTSTGRDDGLVLRNAYVTAVVRCAPPANRPQPAERDRCLPYLVGELKHLQHARVLLALGAFAWDGCLRALAEHGHQLKPKPKFAHGAETPLGPFTLIGSYHPSQQNTFTGRLTQPMLDAVLTRCSTLLGRS